MRYAGVVAVILILFGLVGILVATAIPTYSCESPLVLQFVREEGLDPRCVVVESQGTPGSVPAESALPVKIAIALSGTALLAVGAFMFGKLRSGHNSFRVL